MIRPTDIRCGRCAGYLLVETVVSMAVLSISMLYIHTAVRQSVQVHAQAQDYTNARFLLRQVLSEQELQPELVVSSDRGIFPAPYERFEYSVDITKEAVPVPKIPGDLSKEQKQWFNENFRDYIGRVQVTITWSRSGALSEIIGETLLHPEQLWVPPKKL